MSNHLLTYCMNVHKGEKLADVIKNISDKASIIANQCRTEKKYGLGLRLSNEATNELKSNPFLVQMLHQLMRSNNMFAFTVNAFPYGKFHDTAVKENVYLPTWVNTERVDYTKNVADILSSLLPDYVSYGSISTCPLYFKGFKNIDENTAIQNIIIVAKHLQDIYVNRGKKIILSIEPEPGCYPETTNETIDVFKKLRENGLSKDLESFIGVCFDTAHQAVEWEKLSESLRLLISNDINIGKIQISAAAEFPNTLDAQNVLEHLNESIYLHQTYFNNENDVVKFFDIPKAIDYIKANIQNNSIKYRSHFHIPLYLDEISTSENIRSTSYLLKDDEFINAVRESKCEHFECETYTWSVWKDCNKENINIEEGIIKELQWTMNNFFKRII